MYRVLYVDDESTLLEIGKIFIEKKGQFIVDTAISATEALERLKTVQFDAIISDYQMPEMDGITFLKSLRTTGNTIPFGIFTGRGREEVVIEALNSGADFYLQKGGDPKSQFAELEHKIRLIIEAKKTAEELGESRQRMTDIIDHLPDATFAIDVGGTVIAWNRAMEEMTGIPQEQILGTGNHSYAIPFYGTRRPLLLDLILREDPETERKYAHVIRKGSTLISEIFIPLLYGGKGAYLWFITSPLFDTHGNITGAIESIRDITGHQKVDAALRESEAKCSILIEKANDIIYSLDLEGKITYISPLISRYGYSPEEIISQDMTAFIVEEDLPEVLSDFEKTVSTGQPTITIFRARDKSGKIFWMEDNGVAVVDPSGSVIGISGILRDITGHKAAEAVLRESEQRFRAVFDAARDGMLVADPETHRIVMANAAALKQTGYTEAELLTLLITDLFRPADLPSAIGQFGKQIRGEIDLSSAMPILRKDDTVFFADVNSSEVTLQGRQYRLGIFRDVTERKKVEQELKESEERYRDFFKTSRDSVFITSKEGHLVDVNDAAVEILGYSSRNALMQMRVPELYANPEDRNKHLRTISEQGYTKEYPVDLKRKDGTIIHTLVTSVARHDTQGNVIGFQGTCRNITTQKNAEETLIESEKKYRSIFENFLDLYYETDMQGIITDVSPSCKRLTGFEPTEVIGHPVLELYPNPEQRKALLYELLQNGSVHDFEVVLKNRQGIPIPVSVNSHIICNEEGNLARIEGTIRNITQRRQAEEELFNSRQMLQLVLDTIPVRVFWKDRNSVFLGCNRPLALDAGYEDPAGLIGKTDYEHASAATAEQYRADDQEVMETGKPKLNFEELQVRSDGSHAWLRTSKVPLHDKDGRIIGVLGTYEDITERKLAEEALKESEARLNSILHGSPMLQFVIDNHHRIISWNKAIEEYSGIKAVDVVGTRDTWKAFYESERPVLADLLVDEKIELLPEWYQGKITRSRLVDGAYETTDFFPTMGSSGKWLYFTAAPVRDANRTIIGAVETLEDITERKGAEEALKESEEKYCRFFRTSRDCVFITSKDGNLIDFNDVTMEVFGYSNREELMQVKVQDLYALPEDRVNHISIIADRGFTREYPVDMRRKNGSVIHTLITSVARYDAEGNVTGFQGTVRDITERKQAEEDIKESEARLNSIVHGSPMLQFVIDKNHRVISWNKAIEEYSGIKETEVVGTMDQWKAFYEFERPVLADLLVDEKVEDLREWYLGKFNKSRLVDGAYEATDFFPKMGGTGKWLYFTAAPIRDAEGMIIGAVETLEDITERKFAGEALLKVNQKLTMLNNITRHDILNQLTALQGYLELSEDEVKDPVILEYIKKEKQTVKVVQEQIEFTRNYQDIGEQAPKWQVLSDIIGSGTKQLQSSSVTIDVAVYGVEVFADPLIKKVFYNLMENSLRHGDHVTRMDFSVQETENALIIVYLDNGVGITAENKKKLFQKGFGKHTGLGLFLSREILLITGISITENGEPGNGARFEMIVPKGMYRFQAQLTEEDW